MNIGFYAPLKAPDHPVPSGDREMARSLIDVMTKLGHHVGLLCRLRTYDRTGDILRQKRLQRLGAKAACRIVDKHRPLDIFFTYHPYYKAPDWIGPSVAREMRIPYLIAETSIANKRAGGPWSIGHDATVNAVRAADHVIAMTSVDRECVARCRGDIGGLSLLPPFIAVEDTKAKGTIRSGRPRLIAVAMMRSDVKLQSYRLLAEALRLLRDQAWDLTIVGDGPAADAVRTEFSEFGDRVCFLGRLRKEQLAELYPSADIFVWPGLNEAYGLVFLEAQSHGLPVVAIRNGGVGDVVSNGQTGILCAKPNATCFAQAIESLLTNLDRRRLMGHCAASYVRTHHSDRMASERLDQILREFDHS